MMWEDNWIEKSNTKKSEKYQTHVFKPPCTSLAWQSRNSLQLPESWFTVTYKGKSGGLMGKATEHFKGVALLHDSEHMGTSNGCGLCLGV